MGTDRILAHLVHPIVFASKRQAICYIRNLVQCFSGSTLNVNECNGEELSPMGEYGLDPAGTNEFLPSRFVLGYARVWHSAKWLENMRYAM